MEHFFVSCPRGLEPLLSEDLVSAGAKDIQAIQGGAHFSGSWKTCYSVNLHSRIATRVLWRVKQAAYRNEQDIYRIALDLPWSDWFDVNHTIRVYVSASKSPLKSLDFATLRIKDAICDKFRLSSGGRPNVDTQIPDIRIHAFLDATSITVYLDTSGEPLYKRGLRKSKNIAPLHENLAAGILRLAGWNSDIPLLDPMCGSGTFLLEAVQIGLNIAPGIGRHFGFEKLKNFDANAWQKLRDESIHKQKPVTLLPIYGSDLHGKALQAAQDNFADAGLIEALHLKQANMLEVSAPIETGILVTNPPYGVRTGEQKELAELYPKLGDLFKQKFAGWSCYILTADLRLPKLIRLKTSRRIPLFNGALECRLYEYKMVEGSMRRKKQEVGETVEEVKGEE